MAYRDGEERKAYRIAHREETKAYRKAYRIAHPEKENAYYKAYHKGYRATKSYGEWAAVWLIHQQLKKEVTSHGNRIEDRE